MILSPTSNKDAKHRLLAIGKKRLPAAAKHERFFGVRVPLCMVSPDII